MRPELTAIPPRMRALPIDARGYPVPYFAAWIDGVPDHRVQDPDKFPAAVRPPYRCWVCGQPRGVYKSFVLGPMCTITRTTTEPALHLDCATWSARNCPFLTRPHMTRREDEFTRDCKANSPGEPIDRNPGVVAVWTTRSYALFRDHRHRPLLEVGDPVHVEWYAAGRVATRAEVEASIDSGFPLLLDACNREDTSALRKQARANLEGYRARASRWLPA